MATKAEKRKRGLAKREAFLAEEKARGLAAQKADRDRQKQREAELVRAAQEENRRLNNILAAHLVAGLLIPKEPAE